MFSLVLLEIKSCNFGVEVKNLKDRKTAVIKNNCYIFCGEMELWFHNFWRRFTVQWWNMNVSLFRDAPSSAKYLHIFFVSISFCILFLSPFFPTKLYLLSFCHKVFFSKMYKSRLFLCWFITFFYQTIKLTMCKIYDSVSEPSVQRSVKAVIDRNVCSLLSGQ